MQLSCGPWSYNRFNQYEQALTEGAKPDFLDVDKDGNKKESFKKALKDKESGKEDVKEGSMPPWLKDKKEDDKSDDKKSEKKDDKKSDKKEDCSCKHESFTEFLMDYGWANNPVSAEIIEKHMTDEVKAALMEQAT